VASYSVAGVELADRRGFGFADRADLAGAAGLEGAARGWVYGGGDVTLEDDFLLLDAGVGDGDR